MSYEVIPLKTIRFEDLDSLGEYSLVDTRDSHIYNGWPDHKLKGGHLKGALNISEVWDNDSSLINVL